VEGPPPSPEMYAGCDWLVSGTLVVWERGRADTRG
jgi:hypothetical protein